MARGHTVSRPRLAVKRVPRIISDANVTEKRGFEDSAARRPVTWSVILRRGKVRSKGGITDETGFERLKRLRFGFQISYAVVVVEDRTILARDTIRIMFSLSVVDILINNLIS